MSFKKLPRMQPSDIFFKLYEDYDYAFLFESIDGDRGKFSFIGFEPELTLTIKDGVARIAGDCLKVGDPMYVIKSLIDSYQPCNGYFRYIGGAVGYISYDAVRYWENLPNISIDDLGFPDIEMGVYNDGIIVDHITGEAFYFYRGNDRYSEIVKRLNREVDTASLSFSTPRLNIERDQYDRLIDKVKEYISSGDVFQVVLSKRYSSNFKGDFQGFYLNLRMINPSPYMYFLKMGNRFIIGSSPETLVRVEDRLIESYPIAGTRPITGDPEVDRILENELLKDPKEVSEHIMLLDLARNDLSKVSIFGSVKVAEFMKIYRYSHVQHMVSKVTGKLREDCDRFDVFKAIFPAGTVSGAPKVRAMEVIEELEYTRRGPYAGAVGYFSYNGNMDFAITIRTLFAKDNRLHIQVGSGIVADSTAEGEWFETEFKAKALMKALEMSDH
ncbi:MAG: anthranilate synthase component I family protein [Candidatus Bathyarchaeia archaeon]